MWASIPRHLNIPAPTSELNGLAVIIAIMEWSLPRGFSAHYGILSLLPGYLYLASVSSIKIASISCCWKQQKFQRQHIFNQFFTVWQIFCDMPGFRTFQNRGGDPIWFIIFCAKKFHSSFNIGNFWVHWTDADIFHFPARTIGIYCKRWRKDHQTVFLSGIFNSLLSFHLYKLAAAHQAFIIINRILFRWGHTSPVPLYLLVVNFLLWQDIPRRFKDRFITPASGHSTNIISGICNCNHGYICMFPEESALGSSVRSSRHKRFLNRCDGNINTNILTVIEDSENTRQAHRVSQKMSMTEFQHGSCETPVPVVLLPLVDRRLPSSFVTCSIR